jgi:CBS domain-containing protein
MQREVVTLDVSASLDVADRLMRTDRIRHLPIVSEGRLVGVLTRRDVPRLGTSEATAREAPVDLPRLARISVRDVMATQVFTTLPESTLASAVEMMLLKDVGCLPVLDGERVVGVLTQTDCLRYLGELLDSP